MPSSIETLTLGPEGVLLTRGEPDQLHAAVPPSKDSERTHITRSLELSEECLGREDGLMSGAQAEGAGENLYERGGELALYAMFARAAGRRRLMLFVFLLSIFAVGIACPREYPSYLRWCSSLCSGSLQTSTRQKRTSGLGSNIMR